MTTKSFVAMCIVETIIGAFIGATAVYTILMQDVYAGGACFMGIVIASMLLVAMNWFNVKETKDED